MASLLISDIQLLAGIRDTKDAIRGKDLSDLKSIDNAYVIIENDEIAAFGHMNQLDRQHAPSEVIHAAGKIVIPAWCDSHTHLVHAGSRHDEFVDKINGMSYAEIAARGGGILNSARQLAETTEDQLFHDAWQRLAEAANLGTASLEIKSGYGLTTESELKMLRVIKRLKNRSGMNIKATFLAAHSFPAEYQSDHQGYIRLITDEMLPVIAKERLADYIDVFCEQGFFSNEETEQICRAGMRHGLKPKIHANQLTSSGAVQTAVKLGALSADHLEVMDDAAIDALSASSTIGTLLPSAAFFLRMPFQPAQKMIDKNCAVALATDYNPGSSPGLNMNFIVSLACIGMRMLPEQAINAATFNGACAMEIQRTTGSIAIGKKADLILTKQVPSLSYLPYSFSSNLIDKTFIKGQYSQ